MIGKNAVKVKFDNEGLSKKRYTRDLFNEWQAAMKKAIEQDLEEESVNADCYAYEKSHRYELACEALIIDLLFWVKWGQPMIKDYKDDSNG